MPKTNRQAYFRESANDLEYNQILTEKSVDGLSGVYDEENVYQAQSFEHLHQLGYDFILIDGGSQ